MNLFFPLVIIVIIFLESVLTVLPLTLIFLLCAIILRKDIMVFPVAFFSGLLLDILQVRPVGVVSIYFILCIFLVLLYQRKYEINSYPFVVAAGFLASFGFLFFFSDGNVFFHSILSVGCMLLLYSIAKRVSVRTHSTH